VLVFAFVLIADFATVQDQIQKKNLLQMFKSLMEKTLTLQWICPIEGNLIKEVSENTPLWLNFLYETLTEKVRFWSRPWLTPTVHLALGIYHQENFLLSHQNICAALALVEAKGNFCWGWTKVLEILVDLQDGVKMAHRSNVVFLFRSRIWYAGAAMEWLPGT